MPVLLELDTSDFKLAIWSRDIQTSQATLKKTQNIRGVTNSPSLIKFEPPLTVIEIFSESIAIKPLHFCNQVQLDSNIFFENKTYEFDFIFKSKSDIDPEILHSLNSIQDCFHSVNNSIRGTVNFGNDIGWFRLGIKYQKISKIVTQYISFEVLPVKMVMETDLAKIHQIIDKEFPLWIFAFLRKTNQSFSNDTKYHEKLELIWLAHFAKLRKDLEDGVKHICASPHSRLLPLTKKSYPENIKRKLSHNLEEKIYADIQYADTLKKYLINNKKLSVDTPENRFIKMVLMKCINSISKFIDRANYLNNAPEKTRVSENFFLELKSWKKPLEQLLNRPLFSEVGKFEELNSESLVLHHRMGYLKVYRIWQELKLYLKAFGDNSDISIKSIDELYEIWCLLEIKNILIELNFDEITNSKTHLWSNGIEKNMQIGSSSAFSFTRKDGIKIRLIHEPLFQNSNNMQDGKIYSYTTAQKPDIFLEATFPSGETIHWVFDAKYRISTQNDNLDLIPDDAINQMHRYRDALIYINNKLPEPKSRPIIGAFILYPGWHDETHIDNPYEFPITEVGIGGFPLLPGQPNIWLRKFLENTFNNIQLLDSSLTPDPDYYFSLPHLKVAPKGTSLVRSKN